MVYVVNRWNWVSYVVLMHVKFFDVRDCKFRFNLKNRVGMYLIWWEMGAKKGGQHSRDWGFVVLLILLKNGWRRYMMAAVD